MSEELEICFNCEFYHRESGVCEIIICDEAIEAYKKKQGKWCYEYGKGD